MAVVEALAESLPSAMIQMNTVITRRSYVDTELVCYASFSMFLLTKSFAQLDLRGFVSSRDSGVPTVVGVANGMSVPFGAVFVYRVFSICSRALLFPLVNEISNIGYMLLLFSVALAAQCALIWCCMGTWRKLCWAPINVFTPAEPLLHGGRPILSIEPLLCAAW